MSTLLAAAADYRALEQLLEEAQGELTPELEAWLDEMDGTLAEKTDAYVHIMGKLEANADHLKAEAAKLSLAARSLDGHYERMKARIKDAMAVMHKTEIVGSAWRFKRSPSAPRLIVDDEAKLPAEYRVPKTVYEIQKDALKAAIAKGEAIQGAHIETGDTLRVYANKSGAKA